MSEIDTKKEILELVRRKDHVTFIEIKKRLSGKIPTEGVAVRYLPSDHKSGGFSFVRKTNRDNLML